MLRQPLVQPFEQRLCLGAAQAAKFPQRFDGDVVVHHLSLEERVRRPVLKVVVSGGNEVGNVRPEDIELVGVAASRNVRTGLELDRAVGELLDYTDAKQFVEYGTGGNVAAEAAHKLREGRSILRTVLEREHLGIAVGIGEIRVAYPAGDHAGRPVVALTSFAVFIVGGWRVEQALDLFAGQAREQGDSRGRLLFARDAKLARCDLHIGMLGDIQKSFEGHVVTQYYPKQGTENPLQRGCQGLTYSGLGARFSLHDFGKYIPKKYCCQRQRHVALPARWRGTASVVRTQCAKRRGATRPTGSFAVRQKNDSGALAPRRFLDTQLRTRGDQPEREGFRDGVAGGCGAAGSPPACEGGDRGGRRTPGGPAGFKRPSR